MRILICDDDTLIIEQLKKYIESYFESNHLKCPELVSFTSGEALLTDKGEKDIVFLDIEMPGMNGIYVGNELKKANRNVIVFARTEGIGFGNGRTASALKRWKKSAKRTVCRF